MSKGWGTPWQLQFDVFYEHKQKLQKNDLRGYANQFLIKSKSSLPKKWCSFGKQVCPMGKAELPPGRDQLFEECCQLPFP